MRNEGPVFTTHRHGRSVAVTCRWSVEATSEWKTLDDRKFKGDAGEWETQQGQRANGTGVTSWESHCEVVSRGHAGVGGEMAEAEETPQRSLIDAWTAVVT